MLIGRCCAAISGARQWMRSVASSAFAVVIGGLFADQHRRDRRVELPGRRAQDVLQRGADDRGRASRSRPGGDFEHRLRARPTRAARSLRTRRRRGGVPQQPRVFHVRAPHRVCGYFFPGVVAILLFLRAPRRRPVWQWLDVRRAAWLARLFLILYMPFTYSGGGGPVGNRYFLGGLSGVSVHGAAVATAGAGLVPWRSARCSRRRGHESVLCRSAPEEHSKTRSVRLAAVRVDDVERSADERRPDRLEAAARRRPARCWPISSTTTPIRAKAIAFWVRGDRAPTSSCARRSSRQPSGPRRDDRCRL